jgi:hypothetical protein
MDIALIKCCIQYTFCYLNCHWSLWFFKDKAANFWRIMNALSIGIARYRGLVFGIIGNLLNIPYFWDLSWCYTKALQDFNYFFCVGNNLNMFYKKSVFWKSSALYIYSYFTIKRESWAILLIRPPLSLRHATHLQATKSIGSIWLCSRWNTAATEYLVLSTSRFESQWQYRIKLMLYCAIYCEQAPSTEFTARDIIGIIQIYRMKLKT